MTPLQREAEIMAWNAAVAAWEMRKAAFGPIRSRVRWFQETSRPPDKQEQKERRAIRIAQKGRHCDRFMAVACSELPKNWFKRSRNERRKRAALRRS